MNEERNYEEVIDETVVDQVELVEDKVEEVKKPKKRSKFKSVMKWVGIVLVVYLVVSNVYSYFFGPEVVDDDRYFKIDDKGLLDKSRKIAQYWSSAGTKESIMINFNYGDGYLGEVDGVNKNMYAATLNNLKLGMFVMLYNTEQGTYEFTFIDSLAKEKGIKNDSLSIDKYGNVLEYQSEKKSYKTVCNLGNKTCSNNYLELYKDFYEFMLKTKIDITEFGYPNPEDTFLVDTSLK